MSLLARFQGFIEENDLVQPGDRILMAISGGVDSMVMAHLFGQLDIEIGLAHCNFQLRGQDSAEDESFLKEWTDKVDIPFYHIRFDTAKLAKEQRTSIQLLARELRYEWLESVRRKEGYAAIATAHHLNDSIETFLYNFTKGTGLAGLRGIPIRNGHVIRPILFAKKAEVLAYATQEEIPFREDSSNTTDKYSRNKIRHHLIPKLKEINPALEETAARNFSILNESYLLFQESIERFKKEHIQFKGDRMFISIEGVEKQKSTQQTLLFECLREEGFHWRQVQQVLQHFLRQKVGGIFYSQSHRLLIDRSFLVVEPLQKIDDNSSSIPISRETQMIALSDGMLIFETKKGKPTSFASPDQSAYLDADKIAYPLQLRRWRPGDTFCPLGMKGHHQKLQDFFTNNGFSRYEKEETWLLVDVNDNILWIVGHRVDERIKIIETTNSFLEITYLKDIL